MKIKKNRLLLFFDTEFTDFLGMNLISIGIVSQQFHEFYAENSDYDYSICSDFVKAQVLPKLQNEYAMPYDQLKEKLQIWISDLLEEYETVLFVYDYSGDWDLLSKLLTDYPQREKLNGQIDELGAGFELYYYHNQKHQHHALSDAKALLNGFKLKYSRKSLEY